MQYSNAVLPDGTLRYATCWAVRFYPYIGEYKGTREDYDYAYSYTVEKYATTPGFHVVSTEDTYPYDNLRILHSFKTLHEALAVCRLLCCCNPHPINKRTP